MSWFGSAQVSHKFAFPNVMQCKSRGKEHYPYTPPLTLSWTNKGQIPGKRNKVTPPLYGQFMSSNCDWQFSLHQNSPSCLYLEIKVCSPFAKAQQIRSYQYIYLTSSLLWRKIIPGIIQSTLRRQMRLDCNRLFQVLPLSNNISYLVTTKSGPLLLTVRTHKFLV